MPQKKEIDNDSFPHQRQIQLNNRQNQYASAPFNTTQIRKLWNNEVVNGNPGVGLYQIGKSILKQQIITQSINDNVAIYSLPQASSQFKSKTLRFNKNANPSPGPGQYYKFKQLNQQHLKRSNKSIKGKQTKLMKYLYETYHQKSITLINKNNLHKTVQNDNKNIINKKIRVLSSNQKNNVKQVQNNSIKRNIKTAQPHKKTQNDSNKIVKSIHQSENHSNTYNFISKSKRTIFQRPRTSIGPGRYNYNNSSFKQKIQKNQTSNIRHTLNQSIKKYQKIKIESYQQIQQKQNKFIKLNNDQKNNDANFINCNNISSKNNKVQCFGSRVPRFAQSRKYSSNHNLGPGSYDKELSNNLSKKVNKVVPFGSESQKIVEIFKPKKDNKLLSPCSYNVPNDFFNLMKDNYLRGTIGNFGSTKQRFKKQELTPKKSENQQNNLKIVYENYDQQDKAKKTQDIGRLKFKSFKKANFKTIKPLCYDTQFKTLEKQLGIKLQKNHPFLSGVSRFLEQKQKSTQFNHNENIYANSNSQVKIKYKNNNSHLYKKKPIKGLNIISNFLINNKINSNSKQLQQKQELKIQPQKISCGLGIKKH